MDAGKKLAQVVSGTVAALPVLSYAEQPLEATAPAGVTFTVLNRATVPEFDVRRRYRQESGDPQQHRKVWKIEVEATRMVDVVTVLFTVQPGGHSGWHTHPGPAVFTVSVGTPDDVRGRRSVLHTAALSRGNGINRGRYPCSQSLAEERNP